MIAYNKARVNKLQWIGNKSLNLIATTNSHYAAHDISREMYMHV